MNATKEFKSFAEHKVHISMREFSSDGNAFSLMGKFKAAARRQNFTDEEVKAVLADAMSDDYEHLMNTLVEYIDFDAPPEEDDEEEYE